MIKFSRFLVMALVVGFPWQALAQQQRNGEGVIAAASQEASSAAAQGSQGEVRDGFRRFSIGVQGGAGLDPEILDVGVHATFGPIFSRNLQFRPVFELGAGELTTLLGINLDVLYTFTGVGGDPRWMPYVGAGPNFGLSHRGFETEDLDNVDLPPDVTVDEDFDRFDFGDTDFNGGMNFIVGMRKESGAFFEMKGTAWGVSSIRLLAGFNFGRPR